MVVEQQIQNISTSNVSQNSAHQAIPEYYLPFTPNFADHNIVSPIFAGYFEIVHPTQLNLRVWHLAFKRQINRHVWVILSLKPPSSYGALELPSTSHPLT